MAELTEEQVQRIQYIFGVFDKDQDGQISATEIERAMQIHGMNPTESEVAEVLASMDIDGSGSIDFKEFENIMKFLFQQEKYEEDVKSLRQAFKKFDKDKNGILDRKEFSRLLKACGADMKKDEMEEVFEEVDSDHSGGISIEELILAFTTPPDCLPVAQGKNPVQTAKA